ncbi:MAG: tRNA lysidine(34) synthetase TilS [Bacteroidales bacterium]|nr:tRNA lysidine(34) synthetase TilS [Bacteroidales bacterium]
MNSILAAVSGGIDSMTMADILYAKGGVLKGIAHCNFHLRGAESDADAALVESWAAEKGVPFFKADFDTAAYAAEKGISIEMAARELRYRFFAETAREHGFDTVAVAHNANDNAETLILNMLRGAGSRGMSGMKEESPLPVEGYGDIILWRPLLSKTRKEIVSYAEAHGVPYREDSTNAESEFKRNRIRNIVFPVFEGINPSFVETLCADAAHIAEVDAVADEAYEKVKAKVVEGENVNVAALREEPHWKYFLFRLMEEKGFNESQADSLTEVLESGETVSGRRFLSDEYEVLTAPSGLVVRKRLDSFAATQQECMIVRAPGTYEFAGVRFLVESVKWTPWMPLRQPNGTVAFDAEALPFPFIVRRWRSGDWFRPLGLGGAKKLSDLFTDLHLSIPEKERILVAIKPRLNEGDATHDRVSAVLGLRIDDSVKVTDSAVNLTKISVERK